MFTGYILKRLENRVQIWEGIGAYGGAFAVVQNRKVVHQTDDRDDAEMVAEMIASD